MFTDEELALIDAIHADPRNDVRRLAERTRAGLAAARRGRVGGRKRRMTPGKVESARKLLKGGMSPRDVDRNLGVSIPTLYRWVAATTR
jgi:DNA invertase Pin-like site-specific DNA recombinase